ncbi:hypothetical protein G7Y89_g865 [Cudoniella acicularis]|uniref:Chromo domain-containing protein n=1 Tax=Cudoniella acicularis TaxID=354080 RepID=A0A8H4RWC9_9HELO|nr:hypothetical protein G7Y89_g865 [Cudoniella acicularis]
MPPQIVSEDEGSESGSSSSEELAVPIREPKVKEESAKPEKKGRAKATKVEPEPQPVEAEANEDEDEDEDIGEDEYVVEKITGHLIDDDTGELRFEVKWEGYEKKETASNILNEYLASLGGKEAILEAYKKKKGEAAEKKSKKRGRSSTSTATNGTASKRGRKSHPAEETPPASVKAAEFKPPSGSWEEQVVGIDACEGNEGNVVVYLTWKGDHKTQHPLAQVYKRCPQRMLKFYESHLFVLPSPKELAPANAR